MVDGAPMLFISTSPPRGVGIYRSDASGAAGNLPARQGEIASVTVPAVIKVPEAGRRRMLPLVLVSAALGAAVVGGCGEKSEPAVHPPTTAAATTTASPAVTTTPTATKPAPTPTAPVPKTTP